LKDCFIAGYKLGYKSTHIDYDGMTKRELTPEEIKENLNYLALTDIYEIVTSLEEVISLISKFSVSESGREASIKLREARRQLAYLQSFLSDYPIEKTDTTGQAIG
jgi:hypothetical protein